MGLFDLLRGENDHAKRALVNKWLDGLEPPDPEPLSPISSGSAGSSHSHPILSELPPNPVRVYKPPTPPPTMRRFDNISVAQWQDPFASTLRTESVLYQPYTMGNGLAYESGLDYRRILLPYQDLDSEEDEDENHDETSGQAGKI